jgi:hypothetical protein
MNLYLISQDENEGYGVARDAVVCAPDEGAARGMDPWGDAGSPVEEWGAHSHWCSSPDKVTVQLIGVAAAGLSIGVVCVGSSAGD